MTHPADCRLFGRAFDIACDRNKVAICLLWLALGVLGLELLVYASTGLHLWQTSEVYAAAVALWQQRPWACLGLASCAAAWFYVWGCYLLGAVYRMCAVELASGEIAGARRALAYSGKRYGSLLWSKATLLIVLAFLAGAMALVGRLLGLALLHLPTPVAAPLVVLLWLLALAVGLLASLLALAWLCSSSFMFAAVAMDGTDHYDAVSRSIMYFYHSLPRFAARQSLALVYGAVVFALFAGFAIAAWQLAYLVAGCGAAPACLPTLWHPFVCLTTTGVGTPANVLLGWLPILYWGTIVSFAVSLYITLQTIVYALQRHAVDAIPIAVIADANTTSHCEKENI